MIKLAEPTAGYAKEIMELRQEFLDEDPNVYIHGEGIWRDTGVQKSGFATWKHAAPGDLPGTFGGFRYLSGNTGGR